MSEKDSEKYNEDLDDSGFAPNDPMDGREKGNWKTRYSNETAQNAIKREATYLAILLTVLLVCIFAVIFYPFNIFSTNIKAKSFRILILTWLGGTTGGTLFAIKWLYHTVAKYKWNIDRKWWRYFSPHLSGTLALFLIIILFNEVFNNSVELKNFSIYKALGYGFLAGYFSDSALGKLSEIAEIFFGSTSKRSEKDKAHSDGRQNSNDK